MKKIILIAAAILTFSACTKENDPSLDNTRWYTNETDSGGRVTTYNLSIGKGKGELSVSDRVPGIFDDHLRYEVMSYTFSDETHGTMKFKVLNYGNPNPGYRYGDTSTHSFTLQTKGTKMALYNPFSYAVLELQ